MSAMADRQALAERDERIAGLEAEVERLRDALEWMASLGHSDESIDLLLLDASKLSLMHQLQVMRKRARAALSHQEGETL